MKYYLNNLRETLNEKEILGCFQITDREATQHQVKLIIPLPETNTEGRKNRGYVHMHDPV